MGAWLRASRRIMVLGGCLVLIGCGGLGPMADVLTAGTGNGDIRGEVRRVDERSRTLEVSSWYGHSSLRYDGRTRVIHRGGREYSVRSLEYGDRVSIRTRRTNRGEVYADRIYLEREGRRDTRGTHARVQQLEGRVQRIDQRAGWFELAPQRGSTVIVSLPYRPSSGLENSFRRLRRGDYVRIQGEPLNRNRMELVRIL